MEQFHNAGLALLIFLLFSFTASIHGGEIVTASCLQVTITDLGMTDVPSTEGIISQAVGFPVQINRFNILCLSTADFMDRYQTTSVLVGYFCPTCPGNGTMEELVEQFTFDCGSTMAWAVETPQPVERTIPMGVDFNTPVNKKCALCEPPNRLAANISIYNQSTHCISK